MTWRATMLGGPEDGRELSGPGDVPPPELVVARPHPITAADFAAAEGATVEPVGFDRIVCRRERYSDGRWVYVWPGGGS